MDEAKAPELDDSFILNRKLRRALGVSSVSEAIERAGGDPTAAEAEIEAARQKIAARSAITGYIQDDRSLTFIPK